MGEALSHFVAGATHVAPRHPSANSVPSPADHSRPRLLIAETKDFGRDARAYLDARFAVDLRDCSRAELREALDLYDVVWIRLAHRIDAEMVQAAARCRLIAVPTTGTDHIDLAACRERGIDIVSLRGETEFLREVRATAEATVALTLALLRQVPAAAASVLAGEWNRDAFRGRELFGKTVGLVGLGRLGSIVAEYFRAFGTRVLGYDPRPDFPTEVADRVDSLKALLASADIVSVHVSYDASTHHLLGAPEFDAMRQGAFLVNTARGGVLDEAALLRALESGHLGGAALDVLQGEPAISGAHPLVAAARRLPNLLIVPHIGGNTFESLAKTEMFIARRIAARLQVA